MTRPRLPACQGSSGHAVTQPPRVPDKPRDQADDAHVQNLTCETCGVSRRLPSGFFACTKCGITIEYRDWRPEGTRAGEAQPSGPRGGGA